MASLRSTALRTLRPLHHPTTTTLLFRRSFSNTPLRNDIARVQLIGRIGTEPEVTQSPSGVSMIKYSLACNFGSGENQRTQWHKVAVFGEGYPDRIQKGAKVWIDGDLRLTTYEGEDGKKHTGVTITQRSMSVINRPLSAAAGTESAAE